MRRIGMISAAISVLAAALGAGAPARAADDFVPAIVYDMGGKYDKSFNEAAYNGVERFKKETGVAYREFEITNETQRDQALRTLARRGAKVIAGIGFAQADPIGKVSREFPEVKFCLIDEALNLPNVRSFTFKEQEGSFLVGMLAVMASKTGKVGFVGGMDIPLIRNFLTGYEQGAKHVNPAAEVIANMTGSTPAAWNDPTRGAELARSQFDRGVDVVYAAAGSTGLGVLQAAADAGKLGIGVDSNQNRLHPGRILTSMLKRVDVAVYQCMIDAKNGTFTAGHALVGLQEGAIDWALDEHNRGLITPEMEAAVNRAKDDIIAGRLTVQAYKAGGP
jgi:basic membrane protein A and related proteins